MKNNNNMREKGKKGEIVAVLYLKNRNYSILARNFWSKNGEIDIIARKDNIIHFIEVKSWDKYGIENLEYSINSRKQRRIIETSMYFLFKNKHLEEMSLKYDVIFIDKSSNRIFHIQDAFTGEC